MRNEFFRQQRLYDPVRRLQEIFDLMKREVVRRLGADKRLDLLNLHQHGLVADEVDLPPDPRQAMVEDQAHDLHRPAVGQPGG